MGQNLVAIHVLPHVRKYLNVRLAPGERLADPTTQDLVAHMTRILAVRVLHVEPDPREPTGAKSLLRIVCASGADIDVSSRRLRRLNAMVEELYRQHSHEWMDWLRAATNAPITTALNTWRSRYGINDDDQDFETARMGYVRHRRRKGLVLPHGGHRIPVAPRYP
jgi:hypothetical protein